jgi:hypothetical protein
MAVHKQHVESPRGRIPGCASIDRKRERQEAKKNENDTDFVVPDNRRVGSSRAEGNSADVEGPDRMSWKRRRYASKVLGVLCEGKRGSDSYPGKVTGMTTCGDTDDWGVLDVSGGVLMSRAGGRIARLQVAAPAASDVRPLQGNGWKLEMKEGWGLVRGERPGDFVLRKMQ